MRVWEVQGSSGEVGGGNPDFTSQEAARSVHPGRSGDKGEGLGMNVYY